MTKLELDSKAKTIRLELDLKGETALIQVEARNYVLTQVSGNTFLSVGEFKTSREWLTTLLNQYAAKKPVSIPNAVSLAM